MRSGGLASTVAGERSTDLGGGCGPFHLPQERVGLRQERIVEAHRSDDPLLEIDVAAGVVCRPFGRSAFEWMILHDALGG